MKERERAPPARLIEFRFSLGDWLVAAGRQPRPRPLTPASSVDQTTTSNHANTVFYTQSSGARSVASAAMQGQKESTRGGNERK